MRGFSSVFSPQGKKSPIIYACLRTRRLQRPGERQRQTALATEKDNGDIYVTATARKSTARTRRYERFSAPNAKDARKRCKAVLRLMKKLLKKVAAHAARHARLLEERWSETAYSAAEAMVIFASDPKYSATVAPGGVAGARTNYRLAKARPVAIRPGSQAAESSRRLTGA